MANSKILSALKILRSRKELFISGVHSRKYAVPASQVHTKCKLVNGVYVVTLDSPNVKVNSLNTQVMEEVSNIVNEIETNSGIEAAVIISGKPGCFIAGADISMIENCKTKEEVVSLSKRGHEIFRRIEQSRKPYIAAIQGSCLGGGLETALACKYRIAVKDSKTGFGLPEVMLGLLPGGGGTQRLPALTSIPTTLDLALTGKTVKADKAKKLGIVDLLVSPLGPGLGQPEENTAKYLETVAIQIAKDIAAGKIIVDRSKKGLVQKITAIVMQWEFVKNIIFKKAKEQVMKASRGLYPAPLKILEVVRTGVDKGPVAGYEAEAQGFGELAMTPQSKGLIGLFRGQTECKKNRFGKSQVDVKTVLYLFSTLLPSKCSVLPMSQHATSSQSIVFNPAQITSTAASPKITEENDPQNDKYEYKYEVSDLQTGDRKTHWESRHGDVVRGVYTLYEPDGALRTVEYTADALHGFNAVVRRNAPSPHQYPRTKPSLHSFTKVQDDGKAFKTDEPNDFSHNPAQGSFYNNLGVDFTVNHVLSNDNGRRKFY